MLYRMDPLEIAGGWLNGYEPGCPPLLDPIGSPRAALDRILLRHLTKTPCMVAFSGGRDSSVLLAAAVGVAQREGLPLPIPVTLTYPDAADAEEATWQRQVLDHLGVTERVVLVVHAEHDPVGPIATPLLQRHGVMWPPNFAPTWRMLDLARRGVLLTGESGDEVFGIKRITPVTKVLSSRGHVPLRMYGYAARALAPAVIRRRSAMRDRYRRPWLREPVDAVLARRDAADVAAYALHAGHNAWQFAARRCARVGYETIRVLGSEIGADYLQTFGEPEFVAAVAQAAGRFGWTGRTATMRRLFGDLLPRAVLERTTKAHFRDAVFTGHTREFASHWDGDGVDPSFVDPAALRRNWLSAEPHAPSMALLQQAWLATHIAAPKTSGPANEYASRSESCP